jgi:hypothetical protein
VIKVPELLLRNRKYNQMEIEMDKFLAKKHAVFKDKAKSKGAQGLTKDEAKNLLGFANLSESQMRYKINSCIL